MGEPFGAVGVHLQRFFGGRTAEEDAEITVGTTVVQIANRDPERVSLIFVNLGVSSIFIGPFTTPSTTRGIRLGPSGGTVAFDVFEDAHLPSLQWFGIGDLAGGTLFRLSARRDVIIE